jgi:hypothetical protein
MKIGINFFSRILKSKVLALNLINFRSLGTQKNSFASELTTIL